MIEECQMMEKSPVGISADMRLHDKNTHETLISVIIPVYNSEKYLNRCIASVAEQTYKNLEILLVDDGSIDKSGEICDDWQKKDSRIQVCHKKNEGPGIARNTGLEMARGEYVTFVDSDDWVEPSAYEKLLRIADTTGTEIVGCASIVDYKDGTHRESYYDMPEGVIDKNICILNTLEQNRHAWGAVHNKLFKGSLFENTRFPAVNHLEDYVVTTKLFNETNAVYFCVYPYYHHTCNTASLSMSGWSPARLAIPKTTEDIIRYLREYNDDLAVLNATYRFRFLAYADLLWCVRKSKPENARQIKDEMRKEAIASFSGYMIHSKKKKNDVKLLVKFILSLI